MLVFTIKSLGDFEHLYKYVGRENDFSRDAKEKIFDYYSQLDENVEFEPITFIENFTEYTDPWDVLNDYDLKEWYDSVDVHEVEFTINEWADLIFDDGYLEEILPKDAFYYDRTLEEYIPDYGRKVRLDEMEDYHWLKMELLKNENFKDIINGIVDEGDLFFHIARELKKYHTVWELSDSILVMDK